MIGHTRFSLTKENPLFILEIGNLASYPLHLSLALMRLSQIHPLQEDIMVYTRTQPIFFFLRLIRNFIRYIRGQGTNVEKTELRSKSDRTAGLLGTDPAVVMFDGTL